VVNRDGDDWIVAPERWFEAETRERHCGWVVILRPASDRNGIRRFPYYRIRLRSGPDGDAARARLPTSCRVLDDGSRSQDGSLRIEVEDAAAFRDWLDANPGAFLYLIKYPAQAAEFDATPVLRPISRFQAAVELAQEMQNRHAGSVLANEYAGREIECVLDLAEALGEARTFALTPGDLEETLDLLEAMIDGDAPGAAAKRRTEETGGAPRAATAEEGDPT
jgi:hypothetical protein